ncbi:putative cytochrome P450 [Aspergillus lentulus]|nr:putative cytochrome P450 [Aspergillus lentulus]
MIQPEVSRHISVSNIGHGISARAMSPNFHGTSGTVDIASAMAKITIFTAGSTLQGEEVRSKLTTEFAVLYHDLDGAHGYQWYSGPSSV